MSNFHSYCNFAMGTLLILTKITFCVTCLDAIGIDGQHLTENAAAAQDIVKFVALRLGDCDHDLEMRKWVRL